MIELASRILPFLVGVVYTVGFIRFIRFFYPFLARREWELAIVHNISIIFVGGGAVIGLIETDATGNLWKIRISVAMLLVALVLFILGCFIMHFRPGDTARIKVYVNHETRRGRKLNLITSAPIRYGRRFPMFMYNDLPIRGETVTIVAQNDDEFLEEEEARS